MKWFLWILIWFAVAGLLYLLIQSFKQTAKKIQEEKHKSKPMFKTRYLRK